jgi:hypothetical protein
MVKNLLIGKARGSRGGGRGSHGEGRGHHCLNLQMEPWLGFRRGANGWYVATNE